MVVSGNIVNLMPLASNTSLSSNTSLTKSTTTATTPAPPTSTTTPAPTPQTIALPTPGCETHEPCPDSYCQNGGRCVDTWTSKFCNCATGYTGRQCEVQNMAHFTAESMMHFGSYAEITNLSFWISATKPDGVILYTVCQPEVMGCVCLKGI